LKKVSHVIAPPLCYIFNISISTGHIPHQFKVAKVHPIFKSGDISQCNNYRPISVLVTISKILEKIIYKRLIQYLEHKNILYDHQYGFRKGRSTYMPLTLVVDYLHNALDNHEYTVGLFIDLRKAFDTVNHSILLNKLKFYGVRGVPLFWFENYLGNRSQFVSYNNNISSNQNIVCGVPQGSILGPLLFLIYINDIQSVTTLFTLLFADDTSLFLSGKNINQLIASVNVEMGRVNDWFKANRLTLNVDKTKAIIFKPNKISTTDIQNVDIVINSCKIDIVDEFKLLGVILDHKLTWSSHIQYISTKLSKTIGILHRVKNILNKQSLLSIYYALFHSYINYCILIWGKTFKYNLNKINILHKRAIRTISYSSYLSHMAPLFLDLSLLTFDQLYAYSLSILVFNQINHKLPSVFNNYFAERDHTYNTRTTHNLCYPPNRPRLLTFSPKYQAGIIYPTK
jgi:hypothetical protein